MSKNSTITEKDIKHFLKKNLMDKVTIEDLEKDCLVLMDKKRILERMRTEYFFKYQQCPEAELPEDYPKRVLKAQGFLHAINIIEKMLSYHDHAKSKV